MVTYGDVGRTRSLDGKEVLVRADWTRGGSYVITLRLSRTVSVSVDPCWKKEVLISLVDPQDSERCPVPVLLESRIRISQEERGNTWWTGEVGVTV